MADDLDAVLTETPETPAVETPAPTETPEAPSSLRRAHLEREQAAQEAGRQRNPDGTFAPKQDAVVEPKVEAPKEPERKHQQDPMNERERALLQAAREERRKRQELEEKLAAKEDPPKSFYEDPEGAVTSQITNLREEMAQMGIKTRLDTAETIARSRYQDFDEKVQVFAQIMQHVPGVQQQWLASPDPAEFAYRVGEYHMHLHEAGNLDQLKARMEKELRAKVEAEYKAKQDAEQRTRDAIPDSLSDARGTSGPRVTWGGPPPLDAILK